MKYVLMLLIGIADWPVYNGSNDQSHYSPLTQIDKHNVKDLEVAWSYDTGDAFPGSEMESNPLVIDGILYTLTPKIRVLALDAQTGKLIWQFDPHGGREYTKRSRNRGLTYWTDGRARRLFTSAGNYVYALDAATGKPVVEFGDAGKIDLRRDLGRDPETQNVSLTTPGVVYKDLLIVGGLTSEDLPASPGDIRAYDVRAGKLRWSFHTIPHPGEFGYDTWPPEAWKTSGAANNWAGMALDEKRGLVFVPTGSAAFDFYGADRAGDNLFANCLIALKAGTGERVWHFQFVRHDLWDRDLPAPPTLVTLKRDGREIDGVAQTTKSGHVFVFERETGKPLFPIEYKNVPATNVPGEQAAAQQPFPLKPPPFTRQTFTPDQVTDRTPIAHHAVLKKLKELRSEGQFTPPSLQGTVIFPGTDGGAEWGGAAFDRASGLLFVNAQEIPVVIRLVERSASAIHLTAKSLYESQCGGCHLKNLQGTPPDVPSLADIRTRRSEAEVQNTIRKGTGRMPAFPNLTADQVAAIAHYLVSGADKDVAADPVRQRPSTLKYRIDGYNRFVDPDGYPAIKPPWGTLNAIDLNAGEIRWSIPFGEVPELVRMGLPVTGSENYGGPVVTASGLLFIGATTRDRKFHAYDKDTGKLLWSTTLPAGGNATPSVYQAGGREFVVIAAGGGKRGQLSGGSYIAYALPIGRR